MGENATHTLTHYTILYTIPKQSLPTLLSPNIFCKLIDRLHPLIIVDTQFTNNQTIYQTKLIRLAHGGGSTMGLA
jgi:Cdc6-like AAA superfamily ATPase